MHNRNQLKIRDVPISTTSIYFPALLVKDLTFQ